MKAVDEQLQIAEGIVVVCRGTRALLEFSDPTLELVYRELTGAGARGSVGLYFYRHWWSVMGKALASIVVQVRCEAATPRGAVFTNSALAERAHVHPDTVRKFRLWLKEELDQPPMDVPGDWEYVRGIVRRYVPRIAPDPYYRGTGSPPYRYWALADAEIHHEKHESAIRKMVSGLKKGQREFLFPEVEGIGVDGGSRLIFEAMPAGIRQSQGACSTDLERQGPCDSDLKPMSHSELEAQGASHTDLKPMSDSDLEPSSVAKGADSSDRIGAPCMHDSAAAKNLQHAAAKREPGHLPAADWDAAADCLSDLRAARNVIEELLALPEGASYVVLWVRHILPTRGKVRNPIGFIRSAVRASCTDPKSSWYQDAHNFLANEREVHLQLEKRGPAKPVRVKSEPPPKREKTKIAADAEALYETFRSFVKPTDREAWMCDLASVELVDGHLRLIARTGVNADWLRRRIIPRAVDQIRETMPRFPDVQTAVLEVATK